jgi:LysM domain-containing protein
MGIIFMIKTLYTATSVLLIFCFFTLSSAFGNNTGTLKPFNSKTGFYYTVQKGDTLWDLSQKFYSSEWDWPGLWELNDQIRNPHIIYPGERLRVFFKGGLSLENRPIVIRPEIDEKPVEQKPIEVKVEEIEKVVTPEPVVPEIKLTFYYPFVDKIGFIKKRAVTPVGKLLRAEKDHTDLISENDIIYVEASKNGSLVRGQKYVVYDTKKLSRKRIRHSIKGIVKIEDVKDSYFTAKVLEAFVDIHPDDLLMNYIERDKEFIVKKDNPEIDATLICNDADDSMFGEKQLVYIDRGENDDIEIGQVYTIYKNLDEKKSGFSRKSIAIDPLLIGKLIVVHTEDISSTSYIFSNEEEIHIGDLIQ